MSNEITKISELDLPRGYAKKIMRTLNVSTDSVYRVKMGIVNNDEIKLEILKLAAAELQRKRNMKLEMLKVLSLFDFPIDA